jgi:hypothetical protein
MNYSPQINRKILITLILLIVFILTTNFTFLQPRNCTIFTAVQGETVLFGNNEDSHYKNLALGVSPPTANGFGSIHFGTRRSDGSINFEGAVNDHGLSWDINSTPSTKMNPHQEKPYYLGADNFLTKITKETATVEEAISLAKTYNFGDAMVGQIHIADRTGDAVVISAGPDGEIAFTRKNPAEGYLLSTNFNLATNKGPVDFRWETASSMLDVLDSGTILTPSYAGKILNAVHLYSLTTFTLYSNVIDLENNKVYMFYMSQFDEMVEIDMEEEFSNGARVVDMRDYFSPETVTAGDAAYQRFENRFTAAKIGVVAVGVLLIIGVITLVVRYFRTRGTSTKDREKQDSII